MDACAGMRVWREGLCSCARVKGAPMRGLMRTREGRADERFLRRRMYDADACAEYECERLTDDRIFAKACGARMLARSTNANDAPMRGCSAGSCARVKSAPTSDFCEGVCMMRTLARNTNANDPPTSGYCADSCERVKGAPTSDFCEGVCMMRMLARSTNANGSPMIEFLRKRVGRGCLRGVRMRTTHRCADAPLAHAHA